MSVKLAGKETGYNFRTRCGFVTNIVTAELAFLNDNLVCKNQKQLWMQDKTKIEKGGKDASRQTDCNESGIAAISFAPINWYCKVMNFHSKSKFGWTHYFFVS